MFEKRCVECEFRISFRWIFELSDFNVFVDEIDYGEYERNIDMSFVN